MEKDIPAQLENPTGLHARYVIQKIVPASPEYIERHAVINETTIPENIIGGDGYKPPKYMLTPVDQGAEYFVLRLDEGGKDPEHIKACRIGVNAYADAIKHHLPELAKDLKERYPLL